MSDEVQMSRSHKIVEGLKDAVAGNLASVMVEGQRWVRADFIPKTVKEAADEIEYWRLRTKGRQQLDGFPLTSGQR